MGGAQTDFVGLAGTMVAGGVSVALGNGENDFELSESSIRSLTYAGGSGVDTLDVFDVRVRHGVSVVTGAGADEVYLQEHGGPQTVVGGSIVVDTGAGNDEASIRLARIHYNLIVAMGTGNDDLEIEATTAFAGFLYGGPGRNLLDIDPASRTGIRRLYRYQFQPVT